MKKLLFTAICAMAFSNGFASNNVKEVIEEQVAFFGTHEQCKAILDGVDLNTDTEASRKALENYHQCRNSTVLDEVVIEAPKKKELSMQP